MFFSGSTHRSGPGGQGFTSGWQHSVKVFSDGTGLGSRRAAGLEGSWEETEAQHGIESESPKRASKSPVLSFDLLVSAISLKSGY